MNKIVLDYPVDRLPDDLKEGLPEHGTVEVELRVKTFEPRVRLADLAGSVRNVHGYGQDVIDHIRRLREDR